MHRILILTLALAGTAQAQMVAGGQPSQSASTPSMDPSHDLKTGVVRFGLRAGTKITDGTVTIEVDASASGGVIVTGTGTVNEQPRGSGCYAVAGSIDGVINPRSGGSTGPITIDTGGQTISINVLKTGSSTAMPIVWNITGGNAVIEVGTNSGSSTQNNQINVGGCCNVVNFNSRSANNVGWGGGPGFQQGVNTGGTVNSGGQNNEFNSNGGQWTFRT